MEQMHASAAQRASTSQHQPVQSARPPLTSPGRRCGCAQAGGADPTQIRAPAQKAPSPAGRLLEGNGRVARRWDGDQQPAHGRGAFAGRAGGGWQPRAAAVRYAHRPACTLTLHDDCGLRRALLRRRRRPKRLRPRHRLPGRRLQLLRLGWRLLSGRWRARGRCRRLLQGCLCRGLAALRGGPAGHRVSFEGPTMDPKQPRAPPKPQPFKAGGRAGSHHELEKLELRGLVPKLRLIPAVGAKHSRRRRRAATAAAAAAARRRCLLAAPQKLLLLLEGQPAAGVGRCRGRRSCRRRRSGAARATAHHRFDCGSKRRAGRQGGGGVRQQVERWKRVLELGEVGQALGGMDPAAASHGAMPC